MKLSVWARQTGVAYRTAYMWFRKGKLPIPATRLPSGAIMVADHQPIVKSFAIYARVSSHDQKDDLARQLDRLRSFCAQKGFTVSKEFSDIASGLNDNRKGLTALLEDPTVTTIVVEHSDRLARFGVHSLQAALRANDRDIIIINATEHTDDLVKDFVDVVTSMCARIYGRRGARNRANRALAAAK